MAEPDDKQQGPNPYAPPASKTGSKQDWKKPRGRSPVMFVLFLVVGLISLAPPLTLISLVCAGVGFLILTLEKNSGRNFKGEGASGCAIFFGLLLSGAVMFGGTCNAVVWPVVLTNSGPNWQFDWFYDFLGPHLFAGITAGLVMAVIWIVWFLSDAKIGPDPLEKKLRNAHRSIDGQSLKARRDRFPNEP